MARELTEEEIRVLGCLAEKQATTPDNYPLSSNALVAACNQSTNRDPIVAYTERQVDQAMLAMRDAGLARTVRGDGQRVHKHKHVLNDAWRVSAAELALLSVTMLRGPQTVNELRTRTERYGTGLDDSSAIERHLHALANRDEPFVRLLERRAGEREVRWMHLVGGEELVSRLSALAVNSTEPRRVATPATQEIDSLREHLGELTRRFEALLDRLGETIE